MCPPAGPTVPSLISEGGNHHGCRRFGCAQADPHVRRGRRGRPQAGGGHRRADHKGHDRAMRWARDRFGDGVSRWAIEDCRHLSARLGASICSTAGERVVRVPPKLMAEQRRSARTRGKSDPIDALAVARAALREPDLPTASHDERSRELRLLVDRREDLVAERTRMINRLRWHLHGWTPGEAGADPAPKTLDQARRATPADRLACGQARHRRAAGPGESWPTSIGSARRSRPWSVSSPR